MKDADDWTVPVEEGEEALEATVEPDQEEQR